MSTIKNQDGFLDIFASILIGLMATLGLVIGGPLSQNADNTARQTDAAMALSATMVYISNNSGYLPTKYENGKLSGNTATNIASEVGLEHYTSITVKSGTQAALDKDELWLVTGAQCASETSGTIAAASRSVAVLFVHANGDGFDPQCRDA